VGAPAVLEQGNHLLIDLGTNCELFLKTDHTMLACSTAAGPAFEGAGSFHFLESTHFTILALHKIEFNGHSFLRLYRTSKSKSSL